MRQLATNKVRIHSWSKQGWKAKTATEEQRTQMTVVRHRAPYRSNELTGFYSKGKDLDLLDEVQAQIQIGLASDAMDALPDPLRQMLQAPDVWHIANGKIMKIVDPITQAQDGEWGADSNEADIDVLGEGRSAIRMLLEDTQVIQADASEEDYQDAMGELLETNNGEIIPSSPMVRVNMAVQFIGDNGEDDSEGDYDGDDVVTQFQEPTPVVPHISDEIADQIKAIRDEYIDKIENASTDAEREILLLTMDQKIDQVASRELCNKLDSPYCGYKYSPPRRKHEFIVTGQESHLTEAAQEREKFFYTLLAEASSCKSMEAMHGPIVEETYIDKLNGEEKVKRGRPGGFAGHVRGMYQHDRDLAREWSITGDDSAFEKQRTELIRKLREEGKDEETVRRSVFAWFDRIAGVIPAEYKDGKLTKEGKKWKDSIWRQKRTDALKDLFLTKAQWNGVYKMMGLQKERIKLNVNTNDNERKAIAILQKYFERITNLQDLKAYRQWAEKRKFIYKTEEKTWTDDNGRERTKTVRKWNTYDFNMSMVDYLSTNNAARWWKGLMKKEHYLQDRISLFNKLDDNIITAQDTELDEVSVSCPYPKCEGMAINKPKFAELKDGKGHLFVECECGRNVWLLGHKESGSDIKTMEEAVNAYSNME